jgi:hypothetical protein
MCSFMDLANDNKHAGPELQICFYQESITIGAELSFESSAHKVISNNDKYHRHYLISTVHESTS